VQKPNAASMTLEIKVSVVVPNTLTKLVLVLPVTSLVRMMVKASLEEAFCPLVDILRITGRLGQRTALKAEKR